MAKQFGNTTASGIGQTFGGSYEPFLARNEGFGAELKQDLTMHFRYTSCYTISLYPCTIMSKYIKIGANTSSKNKTIPESIGEVSGQKSRNAIWRYEKTSLAGAYYGNQLGMMFIFSVIETSFSSLFSQAILKLLQVETLNSCFVFNNQVFCFYFSEPFKPPHCFYPLPPLTPIFSTPQPPNSVENLRTLSDVLGNEVTWICL